MLDEIINLYKQNKFIEANNICEKIIKKELNFDELLIISSIKLKIKDVNLAIKFAQKAVHLQPNNPLGYNNLAVCLVESESYDSAIKNYNKAIRINSNLYQVYNNLGLLYKKIHKLDDAIVNFKKCLDLNPNFYQAHTNLGQVCYEKKFYKKAKFHFNIALDLNPNDFLAKYNLSLILLEFGKFNEGWNYYELRKKCYPKLNKQFAFSKIWTGKENLEKKKILIYAEQGIGDIIQFSRYIILLSKLNCHIFFLVKYNLKYLFEKFSIISKISQIIDEKEQIPKFDYYCSLLSLPYLLNQNNKNIIKPSAHIFMPNKDIKWQNVFNYKKLKIGICCNAKRTDKNSRSFNIFYFKEIYNLKNVQLVSLEKNSNYKKIFPKILEFKNLDSREAFEDTASIICNLDLVISCDTSIAHLAGALSKKTLLLLNYKSEWRWGLKGKNTLLYPSFELFRNRKMNEWKYSFDKILNYLKKNYNANCN
jgi:tetratricopeptide (TPR) repeat protein